MNKKELINYLNLSGAIKGKTYVDIQMPNEIFEDFKNELFQNFNHKCFAYSFYYLINFMYRNTIYGFKDVSSYSLENVAKVFVGNHRKVYYITKSGGVLDSIGYTETTNDYPIFMSIDNDIIDFTTIKMLETKTNHSPNLMIKLPVKSFYRYDFEDLHGTYYSFQNTHLVKVNRFMDIISNKNLGHVGLFIYSYLKMMCDKFEAGYKISNEELSEVVGCSERTLTKYTTLLEKHDFIKSTRHIIQKSKRVEKIYRICN